MATLQPKPKIIHQESPNQPIFLYRGSAELIDGKNIIQGEALFILLGILFQKSLLNLSMTAKVLLMILN